MRIPFFCLLFFCFIISTSVSQAQNKSFGVGTSAPNVNAALHVESPGSNQGFIMPRLTTAQRTATGFQGVLTATETGLMVYDIDLKAIYIWDGGKWGSAAKLALPYADTVSTAPNGSNLFRLVYSGAAPGNVGVAQFENMNPNGAGTTLRVSTAGTGPTAIIANSNAANTSPALRIDQAANANAIQTTGKIQAGQFLGDGSLLTNVGGFSLPRKDSIIVATGTTDLFALKYNNAEPKRVLRIETLHRSNGSSALSVGNNSSGLGVYVQNTNDTTSSSAFMATINSNKLSAVPYPVAVYGESTGEAAGGGSFRNTNINNANPALYVEHLGTSAAMAVFNRGTNGHGGYFELTKGGNGGSAVYGKSTGTGAAMIALGIGAGPGLIAEQNNGGVALEIPNGSLKYGITEFTTSGTYTAKTPLIHITGTGPISVQLGTGGRDNGETVTITSTVSGSLEITGLGSGAIMKTNISTFETKVATFLNGYWVIQGMYAP